MLPQYNNKHNIGLLCLTDTSLYMYIKDDKNNMASNKECIGGCVSGRTVHCSVMACPCQPQVQCTVHSIYTDQTAIISYYRVQKPGYKNIC